MAGPDGASGMDDGGTGGGRSENIWAETAPGISNASASASCGKSRIAPPPPPNRTPREVMVMLFTENAANSSLRSGAEGPLGIGTGLTARCYPEVVVPSYSLLKADFAGHKPCF